MNQKIIFLNGTSSSGKTSIAKELLKLNTYLYLSIDDFINKQHSETLKDRNKLKTYFPKIISKFHKAIKDTSDKGDSLIIDHVLEKPEWYKECKEVLKDKPVVWVFVTAPLKELERREANRKDRNAGLAKIQYEIVYKDYVYDIQIDTSSTTSKEATIKIENYTKER